MSIGEIYRYLAELPWVPHAITANPQLQWTVADERRVDVTTSALGRHPPVTFEFDREGAMVRCHTPQRPRQIGRRFVNTGWGGEFREYRTLAGIWMPTRAEVYWELPEGRFVYWRARIATAQVLDDPF